ncbi:hypothetical protein Efla_003795 [Eimeria flavescens]
MPCVLSKPEGLLEPHGPPLPRPKEGDSSLSYLSGLVFRSRIKRRLFLASSALVVCSACNLLTPYLLGSCVDSAHAGEAALGGGGLLGGPLGGPLAVGLLGGPQGKRLAVAGGVFLLGALGSAVRTEQLERVEEEILMQLRQHLFVCCLWSPPAFFSLHPPGRTAACLSGDCRLLAGVLSQSIPSLLRYANSAFGGTAALLLISPRLTAAALLLGPLAGATAMLIAKRLKRLREARQAAEGRWIEGALDRLYAHRAVYVHQQQQQETARAATVSRQVVAAAAATSRVSGLLMGSLSLASNVSLLLVLSSGARLLKGGTLSYGSLTSFALYSLMVAAGCSGLASLAGEWAKGRAAADRIFAVMRPALQQQQQQQQEEALQQQAFCAGDLKGEIEFHNVSFFYGQDGSSDTHSSSSSSSKHSSGGEGSNTPSSSADGLSSPSGGSSSIEDSSSSSSSSSSCGGGIGGVRDVSFRLLPGELLGIAGPSGAGKSTIVRLLTKELRPQAGRITVDGIDLETIPTGLWLRHVLGVVSDSSSKLFAGLTIRENIEYAAWSPSAPAAAVAEEAAAAANCSGFIQQLPQGMATVVGGPEGCCCSSGEQQRLGIARVLSKKPKILLLDEPSSALDPESERFFTESLAAVMQQGGHQQQQQQQQQRVLSALLIAHSPAVLRAATRLVVMRRGEVVETGSFEQLMQQSGTLKALVLGAAET